MFQLSMELNVSVSGKTVKTKVNGNVVDSGMKKVQGGNRESRGMKGK